MFVPVLVHMMICIAATARGQLSPGANSSVKLADLARVDLSAHQLLESTRCSVFISCDEGMRRMHFFFFPPVLSKPTRARGPSLLRFRVVMYGVLICLFSFIFRMIGGVLYMYVMRFRPQLLLL